MNIFLTLGILVFTGYLAGRLAGIVGLPKIIGYIFVGIIFSPHTMHLLRDTVIENTQTLQHMALAFITFAIGGELKWAKIRAHEREIISITLSASLVPLLVITAGFFLYFLAVPDAMTDGESSRLVILALSLLLAALASPTDPTATLAVIHQYKGKGKVKDTILGVAALDDALGILLFSLMISVAGLFMGSQKDVGQALLETGLHIGGGILTGFILALLLNLLLRFIDLTGEGQWIVLIFSLISVCYGISSALHLDELIACMTMGLTVVNTTEKQQTIFGILERYTEEFIFLIFFVTSGLHLDIQSIPRAILPIALFVILRLAGKIGGCYIGGHVVHAEETIKKHTAGGLIPQGGIVIGLALVVTRQDIFSTFSELFLTIIMGATVINEIIGPLTAKHALRQAGEITTDEK